MNHNRVRRTNMSINKVLPQGFMSDGEVAKKIRVTVWRLQIYFLINGINPFEGGQL